MRPGAAHRHRSPSCHEAAARAAPADACCRGSRSAYPASVPCCPQCNQTAGHQPLCLLCDGDDPSFCYDCATLTSYFKYTSISGYYADSEGICQRVRCATPAVGGCSVLG